MHSMAPSRQLLPQFRADDPATTIGRVDRNADIHIDTINEEAGDPRNRLPLSQLVSPRVRGASEVREYMPVRGLWQQFLQAPLDFFCQHILMIGNALPSLTALMLQTGYNSDNQQQNAVISLR